MKLKLFFIVFSLLFITSLAHAVVLETLNYKITITSQCNEGEVSCDHVDYVGVNKKNGEAIKLQGKTDFVLCSDGKTPCHFVGYIFHNENIDYHVSDSGELTVSNGAKILVKEKGVWQSDSSKNISSTPPFEKIEPLICPSFSKLVTSYDESNAENIQCKKDTFKVTPATFNLQKSPAWIYTSKSEQLCGAHANCPFWIVEQNNNNFRILASALSARELSLLKTQHQGYFDLRTSGANSASEFAVSKLVWNGIIYKESPLLTCKYESKKNPPLCKNEGFNILDSSEE